LSETFGFAEHIKIEHFEEKEESTCAESREQQSQIEVCLTDIESKNEVKDLCRFIVQFKPSQIELSTPLKFFIPEYIPAIGECFILLKVCSNPKLFPLISLLQPPRPDHESDGNGTEILSEPAPIQSDPVTLSSLLEECQNETAQVEEQNTHSVVQSGAI
jgi:hypothetical protein